MAAMNGKNQKKDAKDVKVEMLTHYEIPQDSLDEILKYSGRWS